MGIAHDCNPQKMARDVNDALNRGIVKPVYREASAFGLGYFLAAAGRRHYAFPPKLRQEKMAGGLDHLFEPGRTQHVAIFLMHERHFLKFERMGNIIPYRQRLMSTIFFRVQIRLSFLQKQPFFAREE